MVRGLSFQRRNTGLALLILAVVSLGILLMKNRQTAIPPWVSVDSSISRPDAVLMYGRAKQEARKYYWSAVRDLAVKGQFSVVFMILLGNPGEVVELKKDVNGGLSAAVTNQWGLFRIDVRLPQKNPPAQDPGTRIGGHK